MKLSSRIKDEWKYSIIAFAIPFFGMLLVMACSQYRPFGKYSMLYSDMYHQYYPFFVSFRRALLSRDSLLHSWNIGMGCDYLGIISYYLGSPLNLLSILVPESMLLNYFSMLVPIKLGLAALFYSVFLREVFHRNDMSLSLFSAFYGVCAWALGYQWNVMWLDTFALLPLVVLGTVYLIRDGMFILYTVALFLSVAINYYIGLFTCFFVALVFFCYEICRFRGWKQFAADFGRIALFSVIALGMSMIIALPAVGALQTTQSSVNKFPTDFRLNIATSNTILGLLGAMRSVAGNMGGGLEPNFKEGLPNLYCGVGTIMLAFLYLESDTVKLRDKLCAFGLLIFFILSFIIRQLDYIWHGFHFTNMIPYRFSFLYSFVMLYMAYRAWIDRKRFDTLQVVASGLLTAAVLCCSDKLTDTVSLELFESSFGVPVYIMYNAGFLTAFFVALIYMSLRTRPVDDSPEEEKRVRRIHRSRVQTGGDVFLVFVGIEIIATLTAFGLYFPGTAVSNYPKGTDEAESMIRYMHEREADTLFFRAEVTHSQTLNDGALNGYNGISAFTSSANVRITEFLRALGYGAKNTYNRYCFEESSPVANLFLDLKYMIDRDAKNKSCSVFEEIHYYGRVHLLKNRAYLPLGFLAEPELADVDFSANSSPFQFQNELFTAATGVQGDVWHRMLGDTLEILPANVSINEQVDSGYCAYSDAGSGAVITYSYRADRDGFACIHMNLPARNNFTVCLNGQELYRDNISLPQMLAVQDVVVGDVIEVRIGCEPGETNTMTVTAAIMDMGCFWQGYQRLAASKLELTAFRNTFVEGRIDCDRDGLLYTSIPQNDKWSASVDGKDAEIVLVGDCMIAIPLTAGSHTVSFRYFNPAFSLGWKTAAVCLIVFIVLVQVKYRPDWKKVLRKN